MARNETDRKSKMGEPLPEIPDKLYFRIGEVSRLLHLPSYVLRFWETEFPSLKPGKGSTGQRLYRRRDVEAIIEIRRLLYEEGYTIPGARQLLQERARTPERAVALQPHRDSGPSVALPVATLGSLTRGLREIAALLATPAAKPQHYRSRVQGLHRRGAEGARPSTPSLFVVPEPAVDDSAE